MPGPRQLSIIALMLISVAIQALALSAGETEERTKVTLAAEGLTPEEWTAARFAWLDSCRKLFLNIGSTITPMCPQANIVVAKGMPAAVTATSDANHCGLSIRVDSGRLAETEWTVVTEMVSRPGWSELNRNRFGLKATVGVSNESPAVLVGIGKKVAESCLAKADDGYREFNFHRVGHVSQVGTCIDNQALLKLRTLIIHTQTGVMEYDYELGDKVILRQHDAVLTAEDTILMNGPLFECGVLTSCRKPLGERTIRWRFTWLGRHLQGQVIIVDRRDGEPTHIACEIVSKFVGTSAR